MVDLPLGPLARPAFAVFDPRFEAAIRLDIVVERLWTGGTWTEGPAWLDREQCLIWSDIPGNRMLRWEAAGGTVTAFREPSRGGNGNTVDREGRLVTCEQYSRRITRTEPDGAVTLLIDNYRGQRFNAPNDVVVKSDGSVWFSDPDYGRSPLYEGNRELDGCHVYRFDPTSGQTRQMTHDLVMPNGLAFSPDERLLYIIDTGSTHVPGGPNHIRRFSVGPDDVLGGGEVFATNRAEKFDGLRLDTAGRMWCGAEDGVHCYAPDGTLIGKLLLPERASNLCFGGDEHQTLFITGTTSIYRCDVAAEGVRLSAA